MKRASFLVFLAAILAGLSCVMATMALPAVFDHKAMHYPVQDRPWNIFDKNFAFGPYKIQDIKRGWALSESSDFFKATQSTAAQKYRFVMTDKEGKKWNAGCLNRASSQDLNLDFQGEVDVTLGTKDKESLACEFKSGSSYWRILLSVSGDNENKGMRGGISNGQITIMVEPVFQYQKNSLPSTQALGFLFKRNKEVIGSVDLLNNGSVALSMTLSPELETACALAASALLLYPNVKSNLDREE